MHKEMCGGVFAFPLTSPSVTLELKGRLTSVEFRCHLKVQNFGHAGWCAGVFPHVPIDCCGKSLWFYRCSVLFLCALCSTAVCVYSKKSTSKAVFKNDPNCCLFSECVLVPFLLKKIL